ncbi:hypothetical protein [Steroidobacter sp.]|uniref:hypothetical protein n=1 Tax=Steroidobacter sp. TaxID=1978227 RepID=UPI001A5EA63E|nr:hypothetical protein [Steroidobacter sp.]MBL8269186.1 hypothetical protein [Steroidobacter sp.]
MSTAMRCTLPLMLVLASAAVHAAEEKPGTLSKEATAAGPAVDTSKTTVTAPAAAEATEPTESKKAAAQPTTTSQRAGGPQAVVRNDRLNLDTTVVTGNRELPKVLYIVPWKKSDLGDLPAQPFNTLLDEALTPVDRDVFRREVTYYGAMNGAAAPASPQPQSTEK